MSITPTNTTLLALRDMSTPLLLFIFASCYDFLRY